MCSIFTEVSESFGGLAIPYISSEKRRNALDRRARPLGADCGTVGELNYALTRTCLSFLGAADALGEASYQDYNEVLGVLECVKQEIYRRVIAPYEDGKMAENGDVYSQKEESNGIR